MSKPILRFHLCDFWAKNTEEEQFFRSVLAMTHTIVDDEINPELVLYSLFGVDHKKYYCRKMQFIGEPVHPDFTECDYALSFDDDSDSNHYLPLYALFGDCSALENAPPRQIIPKPNFCNFLYSNPGARERIQFFDMLNQKKRVDAGGRVRNNMGYRVRNKLEFIASYKFTIAFENSSQRGYITEKILQPLLCGSIPIYWGEPSIANHFNPKAFINTHDYNSFEEVIDTILEIDSNDELYASILAEPLLLNNRAHRNVSKSAISTFFQKALNDTSQPVAQKSMRYNAPQWLLPYLYKIDKLLFSLKNTMKKLKQFRFEKLRFRNSVTTIRQ